MKRFNFKLEKLLAIREYKELLAKLKYANELQKKLNLENMNINLENSILNSILEDYSKTKNGDVIDYNDILLQENYINNLIKIIKTNENKKKEMLELLEKLKEELNEKIKERKIITKLKEKKHENYKKENKKEEIKRLDEVSDRLKKYFVT